MSEQRHPLDILIDQAIAGELKPRGTLGPAVVRRIRLAAKADVPVAKIAEACRCSRQTVYDILKGKTWKGVE